MRPGDEWPEAPGDATYRSDGHWYSWEGHGWTVPHPPPPPWPFMEAPFPRDRYGPPGTVWVFSEADLLAEPLHVPSGAVTWVLNRALKKLGVAVGAGNLLGWRTPEAPPPLPEGFSPMRWAHVTIVGTIGTTEQVAHTFNFRSNPADADKSEADLLALATKVRDQWVTFLGSSAEQGLSVAQALAPELTYTEVRAAYLEQTAPASFTMVPGKTRAKKHYVYPRPAYLVLTQYAPFDAGVKGAGSQGLPWEVAMACTFTTGKRGPRFKGRVFLGPLDRSLMQAGGHFDPAASTGIGTALGTNFVQPLNATTNWRLHVVSRTFATSEGVNGISMGQIPDSQRRRRRSQPELAAAAWAPPAS